MHSAEHILNQTMVRMFNKGRSFSAHIEKKKSKCDYRFERNLSAEEVSEIEKRVNEVITANLQVTESFIPKEEASAKFNLERLPDEAGDSLRIISIGDYDDCPALVTMLTVQKRSADLKLFQLILAKGCCGSVLNF